MAYPVMFRKLVLQAVCKYGIIKTSTLFNVSRTSIWRWQKNIQPSVGVRKRPRQDAVRETVLHLLQENPFMTQDALAWQCNVCIRTIRQVIKNLRWSRKRCKRRGVPAKPANMPTLKRDFASKYSTALQQGLVVSVDECGFSERVVPLYGYSAMGEPLIVKQPGTWKHTSLLMAIFSDGRPHAFTMKQGAIKAADFNQFVQVLQLGAHDSIVMDNASIHCGAKHFTSARILNTPPYCPESNPIEMAFASIKHSFRLTYSSSRTVQERIAAALAAFPPDRSHPLFQHVRSVVDDSSWARQDAL
jgi:transposase